LNSLTHESEQLSKTSAPREEKIKAAFFGLQNMAIIGISIISGSGIALVMVTVKVADLSLVFYGTD
jgi:hypothetical protein